jgi:hypothetical protein
VVKFLIGILSLKALHHHQPNCAGPSETDAMLLTYLMPGHMLGAVTNDLAIPGGILGSHAATLYRKRLTLCKHIPSERNNITEQRNIVA